MTASFVCILANLLQTQPSPAQDLRFSQPQVNLGELRSHVVRTQCFEFVNQGTEPVEIDHVEPSCGCLEVKLEKRRFQPGEKGELNLQIRPTTQATGPHTWFAKVVYRVGQREVTTHLQLQAVVRNDVTVSPVVLVWTGSRSRDVTITDLRDSPMTVVALQFTSPLVTAKLASVEKGVTRIVLQTTAAIPVGRHDEMLRIYVSDPLYSPLEIPVTLVGQARSAITVTPDQVTQHVAVGQPVPSTLIRLRPSAQRAVAIQAVSADDPAITCTFAQGPFNEATLKIQVDAAKLGGRELNGVVRVQVREPVEEEVVIPVRVTR